MVWYLLIYVLSTLAGRFELRETIGQGTFAQVWRAQDLETGHPVALKLFHSAPDVAANVLNEVAAGLRMPPHPNVVRALAFFESGESPCLVLDYVPGSNLAEWLARQPAPGPDSAPDRLVVLRDLLRGLAHAHASGVAHRDLSFGNVLVAAAPLRACLTDFGGAWFADPPAGLADAFRQDVYAFAVLAYLTLSGRHPLTDDWQSQHSSEWSGATGAHASLPRRRLVDLAPWLASHPHLPALSAVLGSCVAADPGQRPSSAVALAAAWDAAGFSASTSK